MSSSFVATQPGGPSGLPYSQSPLYSSAGTGASSSTAVESTSQHPSPLPPFPIFSNITSVTAGPTGSTPGIGSTSYSSLIEPKESQSSLALPISSTASTSVLLPAPISDFVNTTITSLGGYSPVASDSVVVVTLTPSAGTPIVFTTTVIAPAPVVGQSTTSVVQTTSKTPLPGTPQLPSSGGSLPAMASITPQPSQAPAPGNESQVLFPSLFAVDVVIDGQTYHLPQPNEPAIPIILQDGSLAQLLAGQVVLRGQTFPVPQDTSNAQPIIVGGVSLQAQPAQSAKPDTSNTDDGHHGGGGLFGFLGKVGGAAGSAAKDLGNAASGALNFASSTGGASASNLAGAFSGVAKSVDGVISSLNGIQQSFPTEGLSKAGMNTFTQAQNLGRSSVNWMQSMSTLLGGFDNLKPDVQQQVKANMADFAKPGGQLQQAGEAMKALSEFPWEDEAPKTDIPSPTATPKASESARASQSAATPSSKGETSKAKTSKAATSASTKTTSASSSSSSPTPTSSDLLPYYISTRRGTSLETFNKFIQDLDGGVGHAEWDDIDKMDCQIYTTNLTTAQGSGLTTKYPFLLIAYANVADPKDLQSDFQEEFHVIPRNYHSEVVRIKAAPEERAIEDHTKPVGGSAKLMARALLPGGENVPYWKKMISSPPQQPLARPPSQDPPYAADDSLGRGVTIYVLDDGFDITRPVSLVCYQLIRPR